MAEGEEGVIIRSTLLALSFLLGCTTDVIQHDGPADASAPDVADGGPPDAEPCAFDDRTIPGGAGFADGCNVCECRPGPDGTGAGYCTAAYCTTPPECTRHADCLGGTCIFDLGCATPRGFCCTTLNCRDPTRVGFGWDLELSTHCTCEGETVQGHPIEPYDHMRACAGAADGSSCSAASDCQSGHCVDGVCCASECDAICESCGSDGQCAPIAAGTDPANECAAECNATGACGGHEACEAVFAEGANVLVGAAPDGSLLITGQIWGEIDLGDGLLVADGEDIFLAKRNSDCTRVWQRQIGGALNQTVTAMSVAADGSILLSGAFNSSIDFGGPAPLTAPGGAKASFVARLDSAGAHLFSLAYGSDDGFYGSAADVRTDSANGIVISGQFIEPISFGVGDPPLISAGGKDAYVVKLAADGSHVFSRSYGGAQDDQVSGVGIDASGEIIVAVEDTLMRLGPEGQMIWSRPLGVPHGHVRKIAVSASGGIILGGEFEGTMDLGGGVLVSEGYTDVFVAELTSAGDGVIWQRRIGDESFQELRALAVDPAGRISIAGSFSRTIDLGGGKYRSNDLSDVFAAQLAPNGAHLFTHVRTSEGGGDEASGLAVDAAGRLFVAGSYGGSSRKAFLMSLNPNGAR